MKKLSTIILFLLCAIAAKAVELRSCDLLFVVANPSEFSQAISRTTTIDGKEISFDHVAIVYVGCDSTLNVIEAVPETGVTVSSLDSFLQSCPTVNSQPAVVVKRLTCEIDTERIIQNALQFVGQPYDWWYLPDNGKMYCSELVYESYIPDNHIHIFDCEPMNFKTADGEYPDFWIRLFQEIDRPIPQGIPGTNPNSMANNPQLEEIYRFF